MKRARSGLPGPGHKIEFFHQVDSTTRTHTMRQGRHYHKLEALKGFLEPHFRITDSTVIDGGPGGDYFLSVICQKVALMDSVPHP